MDSTSYWRDEYLRTFGEEYDAHPVTSILKLDPDQAYIRTYTQHLGPRKGSRRFRSLAQLLIRAIESGDQDLIEHYLDKTCEELSRMSSDQGETNYLVVDWTTVAQSLVENRCDLWYVDRTLHLIEENVSLLSPDCFYRSVGYLFDLLVLYGYQRNYSRAEKIIEEAPEDVKHELTCALITSMIRNHDNPETRYHFDQVSQGDIPLARMVDLALEFRNFDFLETLFEKEFISRQVDYLARKALVEGLDEGEVNFRLKLATPQQEVLARLERGDPGDLENLRRAMEKVRDQDKLAPGLGITPRKVVPEFYWLLAEKGGQHLLDNLARYVASCPISIIDDWLSRVSSLDQAVTLLFGYLATNFREDLLLYLLGTPGLPDIPSGIIYGTTLAIIEQGYFDIALFLLRLIPSWDQLRDRIIRGIQPSYLDHKRFLNRLSATYNPMTGRYNPEKMVL